MPEPRNEKRKRGVLKTFYSTGAIGEGLVRTLRFLVSMALVFSRQVQEQPDTLSEFEIIAIFIAVIWL